MGDICGPGAATKVVGPLAAGRPMLNLAFVCESCREDFRRGFSLGFVWLLPDVLVAVGKDRSTRHVLLTMKCKVINQEHDKTNCGEQNNRENNNSRPENPGP